MSRLIPMGHRTGADREKVRGSVRRLITPVMTYFTFFPRTRRNWRQISRIPNSHLSPRLNTKAISQRRPERSAPKATVAKVCLRGAVVQRPHNAASGTVDGAADASKLTPLLASLTNPAFNRSR